jgi:hypothetical protein
VSCVALVSPFCRACVAVVSLFSLLPCPLLSFPLSPPLHSSIPLLSSKDVPTDVPTDDPTGALSLGARSLSLSRGLIYRGCIALALVVWVSPFGCVCCFWLCLSLLVVSVVLGCVCLCWLFLSLLVVSLLVLSIALGCVFWLCRFLWSRVCLSITFVCVWLSPLVVSPVVVYHSWLRLVVYRFWLRLVVYHSWLCLVVYRFGCV